MKVIFFNINRIFYASCFSAKMASQLLFFPIRYDFHFPSSSFLISLSAFSASSRVRNTVLPILSISEISPETVKVVLNLIISLSTTLNLGRWSASKHGAKQYIMSPTLHGSSTKRDLSLNIVHAGLAEQARPVGHCSQFIQSNIPSSHRISHPFHL